MNHKISGYCENCEGFDSVYYDFILEKYWCKNCNRVEKYDFTLASLK